MSSVQATKDALSIVDTLKLCILKQDKIIRAQNEEIQSLKARVKELEKESIEFRQRVSKQQMPSERGEKDETENQDVRSVHEY